jgi:[ribosomal protein S18]-alanine N-acetyltransferase
MPSFRLAHVDDLLSLASIESAAGFNHWSEAQLEESLQNHTVFVAEECGELTGFAIFHTIIDEAELLNIVVAPAQQGKGIGKALLLYVLKIYNAQNIERCFLEVAVNNLPAVALYKRLGFMQVGLRKNYYVTAQGKIDAIIMQLDVRRDKCKN